MKRTHWAFAAAMVASFGLTMTLAGCNNEEGGKAPEGGGAPAASGGSAPAGDQPAPEPGAATGSSPGKAAGFPAGYPKGGSNAEAEKAEKKEGDASKPATEGEKKEGDAGKTEEKKEGDAGKAEEKKEGEPKTAAVKLSDEEIAAIKKLPEAEQKIALAQAVCPSSDEHLGAMGTPVKVDLKGQTVYACCKGCVDEMKAEPDKFLAKLKK